MRRQTITRDQVFEAADQIVDMGLNPTQNAIIRRVGGSFTTVGRYMEEWRRERRAANENPATVAPDQLLGAAKTFAEEIWGKALDLATARLSEDQRRLKAEQAVIDEDRVDMLNQVQDLEEVAATQEARITTLEQTIREAISETSVLQDKLARANERAGVAEARLADANRRIDELLESVVIANQRNAELLDALLPFRHRKPVGTNRRSHSK
ncbi:DNA-binding protein [Dongia sp.]|uniref:DNA-binding protein n=1 Tax=Dongia sp. TaxID=1977262 RepID=UPI0035AF3887